VSGGGLCFDGFAHGLYSDRAFDPAGEPASYVSRIFAQGDQPKAPFAVSDEINPVARFKVKARSH
jgi:hypothetical protein